MQALQDRYLRLAAEFDNFRKRTERDMAEYRKRAQDTILVSVLMIYFANPIGRFLGV